MPHPDPVNRSGTARRREGAPTGQIRPRDPVFACKIHKDAPHDSGGSSEEVSAVLPFDSRASHQADESIVDQRGGLQQVLIPVVKQLSFRKATQFGIHDGRQTIQSGKVARAPVIQDAR